MNKRGLSQVVTTIIIILLIIIAIGGIWTVLNATIFSESGKISLDKMRINLKIESAKIDNQTGIAYVKVSREVGEGNLVGIKFIVKDSDSSEIFDVSVQDFLELSERTFELNLSQRESLTLSKVDEISVAPLYLLPDSSIGIGGITDSMGGLAKVFGTVQIETPGSSSSSNSGSSSFVGTSCIEDSDCPLDSFIQSTIGCYPSEGEDIYGQFEDWSCKSGFCFKDESIQLKSACPDGQICDGDLGSSSCILQEQTCQSDSECPLDKYIGQSFCVQFDVIGIKGRYYRDWTCNLGTSLCTYSDNLEQVVCAEEEECIQFPSDPNPTQTAQCLPYRECMEDTECAFGEICNSNFECEIEVAANSGTVSYTWPATGGLVEFFSSASLLNSPINLTNYYVVFPITSEPRCLRVSAHVNSSTFSYIALNVKDASISPGIYYEIWKTDNGCSLL